MLNQAQAVRAADNLHRWGYLDVAGAYRPSNGQWSVTASDPSAPDPLGHGRSDSECFANVTVVTVEDLIAARDRSPSARGVTPQPAR